MLYSLHNICQPFDNLYLFATIFVWLGVSGKVIQGLLTWPTAKLPTVDGNISRLALGAIKNNKQWLRAVKAFR